LTQFYLPASKKRLKESDHSEAGPEELTRSSQNPTQLPPTGQGRHNSKHEGFRRPALQQYKAIFQMYKGAEMELDSIFLCAEEFYKGEERLPHPNSCQACSKCRYRRNQRFLLCYSSSSFLLSPQTCFWRLLHNEPQPKFKSRSTVLQRRVVMW